jgi:hypothetical protein
MSSGTITINRVSGNVVISSTVISGTVSTALTTATGIPSGGTTGQVLAKNSNTSYDVKWSSSGGGGGSSVSVNGALVTDPNFNGTTPAAPASHQNITFQVSGDSVSAYIPNPLKGDKGDDGKDGTSFTGSVNGAAATDIDLDDATPAAPAGGTNVKWQIDGSDPKNVSSHIDWGTVTKGWIQKPTYMTEFFGIAATYPWATASSGSGTIAQVDAEPKHPGIIKFGASATQYSGYRLQVAANSFLLAGGEECYAVLRYPEIDNIESIHGFADNYAQLGAIATVTDGAFIRVPAGGLAEGRTSSNGTQTVTGTTYQLAENTWYTFKITVSADGGTVTFYIYGEDGTLLWSAANTTNIPTGAGRMTGHYVSCYSTTGSDARDLMWIDLTAIDFTKALERC